MVKNTFLRKNSLLLLAMFLCGSMVSCVDYKAIPYFKDVPNSATTIVKPTAFVEPVIQFDDILSITINTLDMQGNSAVNMPTSGSGGGATGGAGGAMAAIMGASSALSGSSSLAIPSSSSYRVNKKGEVDIPLLGKITASGLTTSQLKDTLQRKLVDYYKMPTVDVKFANFRVTVLGEVLRPGTYTVPNEKISVIDALGLSGDLTIFGKRENVLLIRDSADNKQMVRLDLNSKWNCNIGCRTE